MWIYGGHVTTRKFIEGRSNMWTTFQRDPAFYNGYIANVSCIIHDMMERDWTTSNIVADKIMKLIFTYGE